MKTGVVQKIGAGHKKKTVGGIGWKSQINISEEKYVMISRAILNNLTSKPIRFNDLINKIKADIYSFDGSVEWYVIVCLRHLERENKVVRMVGNVVTYALI